MSGKLEVYEERAVPFQSSLTATPGKSKCNTYQREYYRVRENKTGERNVTPGLLPIVLTIAVWSPAKDLPDGRYPGSEEWTVLTSDKGPKDSVDQ
ncbi:hypothetical protein NDU88_005565 [Pleurodeles waltl]|uniref:Uncharacterized protein n=1 Tax=Pleurodeles waltl TaxID=8319 RepID=A0AAV7UIH5_PLEWA|nr:hypothetical protein NDU88_005565 [Pleurodeles waltl]